MEAAVEIATAIERPDDPVDLDRTHPEVALAARPQPAADIVELEELTAVAHVAIVTEA
jgi:hypothetical protein